jgi:hypothetical protein
MGVLISYYYETTSITSVLPSIKPLSFCTFHTGQKEDLQKLYKNYLLHSSNQIYLTKSELRRITHHTNLQGFEDMAFTFFLKPRQLKLNIMEIFAAIITYSNTDWEYKVGLGLRIFDFDGSKNLTEDEFFIMLKCFVDGVSVMTGGVGAAKEILKDVSKGLFENRAELGFDE